MINDESKRKLREMKLDEFIDILEIQQKDVSIVTQSFDERLQQIVDYVFQAKYNSKIQRLIKLAKFRLQYADVNDVVYLGRGIDKSVINELSTGQFIDTYSNIIFQGFTGSGKTYLSCAIGKQCCKKQVRTKYIRIPDLLMEFDESKLIPRGIQKILKKYSSYKLLILDEWLLEDISDEEQHFLFELIERRHDNCSTIFCTQYKAADWHARLGGGVHADAIMDRIIHNAVWVNTGDKNMRAYYSKNK